MKDELKIKYLDPEEPLGEGLQHRVWVSKEDLLDRFPENSKIKNNNDLIYRDPDIKNMSESMKEKFQQAKQSLEQNAINTKKLEKKA